MLKDKVMDSIIVNEKDYICLSDALSFGTVPELNKKGRRFIEKSLQQLVIVDFANVTSADNAGVALLISWVRYANSIDKEISFINLPKQLMDLIDANALNDILPIN